MASKAAAMIKPYVNLVPQCHKEVRGRLWLARLGRTTGGGTWLERLTQGGQGQGRNASGKATANQGVDHGRQIQGKVRDKDS